MSKQIGNGVTRMLRFNVARAMSNVSALVTELGRDAFVSEDRTAVLLGCTLAELDIMRGWKRNDLGLITEYKKGTRPFAHYENNQLDYYYRIQNLRNAYPVTALVQALLVHDVSKVMNGREYMLSKDICEKLKQVDPWKTWLRVDPKRGSGIRPISPTSLSHVLKWGDSGIDTRNTKRDGISGVHCFHKDLEGILKRYPTAPMLDKTLYTRERSHVSATELVDSGRWGRGRSCAIYYNLGELQDYLTDPWPKLKVRASLKQIVYCVGNPKWWAGPMSRNGLVKIGYSEDLGNFASRLRHYRCSSHMPANPIVHWAIEAPTRLLLEKRIHNIYMDRQVESVGRGRCGGEMFETSPVRYSPDRMLNSAIDIVESYGYKYKLLKQGDFNKGQQVKATACLWRRAA